MQHRILPHTHTNNDNKIETDLTSKTYTTKHKVKTENIRKHTSHAHN